MKKTKEHNLIVLVGLLLILATFYWYSLRPYYARKYCSAESFRINHEGATNSPAWLDNQAKLYMSCLGWKGLAK